MENRKAIECNAEDRGVSFTDVSPFCHELEKFIKHIANVRDLNYLTYEYPSILQNRLDASVCELETMLAEIREALVNAERLKTQRKSINTEKMALKKILKRMRDDEVREMECVVSLHDKPMFSRWENVRTTHKPEALEVMLTDIKSKQLALENLTILVTRKLNQVKVFHPINGGEINNEKNSSLSREKSVIPLPFPSFCTPLIPTPPPLPLPAPVSHLPKRSHTQRLTIQRRRRLERRDENLERRCVVVNGPNVDGVSLLPLTLNDFPSCLASDLYPVILSPAMDPNHDIVPDNRACNTTGGNRSNGVSLLENDNGTSGLTAEFQNEMRTVLQALYGDLRSAPTLILTESTSGNENQPENTSTNNGEIELYTLRKTQ